MPITYSLQNLLLDDPPLDDMVDLDGGLLGPIVRMRWISNLVRLAVLEEADQCRAAAGEYAEHDAEIRRLRRASMAPDAGRYYPVDGKSNRIFKNLRPEQARQIVEHWLQTISLGDRHEQPQRPPALPAVSAVEGSPVEGTDTSNSVRKDGKSSPRAVVRPKPISPSQWASPARPACGELVEPRPVERERKPGEYFERFSVACDDDLAGDACAENGIDDNAFSHDPEEPARARHKSLAIPERPHRQTPPDLSTVPTKHQTRNSKHKTGPSRVPLFAGAAAVAAVMLLAALLGVAATWFLKARTQPTSPRAAPVGRLSTTQIVPSAIPRNSVSAGALRVRGSPITKHQTPNTES
jgi:hypothetical protein